MIDKEKLGKNGPMIARLGYGAMVLEGYYGESDDQLAIKTLTHAIEQGMMIDTADAYGAGHNELLIAEAIKRANTDAFIATKFGMVYDEDQDGTEFQTGWGFPLTVNGSKNYFKKCLEKSLKNLNVDTIDLMYTHFVDPNTAIEDTIEIMAKSVTEGKVKYLGLCNVNADEVRKAHAVHPISAVQVEYSLWNRKAEAELIPTLRELGIALVCWSPLGAGFLTGQVDKLDEGDFRNNLPKFQGSNLKHNIENFSKIKSIASNLNISTAQLALSWLLHQGDDIFPIPGTRKISRIDENNSSLNVKLSKETLTKLNNILTPDFSVGSNLI